jgi:hypothetical protein
VPLSIFFTSTIPVVMWDCHICLRDFAEEHGLLTHIGRVHKTVQTADLPTSSAELDLTDYEQPFEEPLYSDQDEEADYLARVTLRNRQIRSQLTTTENPWAPFDSELQMLNAHWFRTSYTTKGDQDKLARIHEDNPSFELYESTSIRIDAIARWYPALDTGEFRIVHLGNPLSFYAIQPLIKYSLRKE